MATTRPRHANSCRRCGRSFSSWQRLQHHQAAEHAPQTLRDIRVVRGLPVTTIPVLRRSTRVDPVTTRRLKRGGQDPRIAGGRRDAGR